jgi:hypothetical protein
MFNKETEWFSETKKDFSDIRSNSEGGHSRNDLMTDFTILSKVTFLLINCFVCVAFAVCFEKLLEEKGPKKNSNKLHVSRGPSV